MIALSGLLEAVARRRTDEVVVTTMSTVRPWGRLSDHPLDFASADSAMGHAADFALGIALAQPQRGVICFNGDGSMLMSLGTLATVVGSGAGNLILFVVDNGGFEITGGQAVAGAVDYAAVARAAGFPLALTLVDEDDLIATLDRVWTEPGPALVHVRVALGSEGPIRRGVPAEPPYLRASLAESALALHRALTVGTPPAA